MGYLAGQSPWPPHLEFFNFAIDNLTTGMMLLDENRNPVWANDSAKKITSSSLKQLCSRPLEYWIETEKADELVKLLNKCLMDGSGFTFHEVVVGRNGQNTTANLSCQKIPSFPETPILVEITEIDHVVRMNRESEQMIQGDGFRQIMRGLAHEIRNPLGGIKGAAQLLRKELTENNLSEYLDIIVEESDRLRALLDRLIVGKPNYSYEELNIHQVIERIRLLVMAESKGKVHVSRRYDPSLPNTRGNSDYLLQALLNIARNALDALSESNTENPTVHFSTRAIRRFSSAKKRGFVSMICVRIEDNGPGIPPEIRNKIFFPMVSGRPNGSGIGLMISQSIIQHHNGWIEVSSKPGKTCIDIILQPDTPL